MNLDDPVAPYKPLVYHGSSIKIDTKGKTVVVPTGNPTLLSLFNEYVENADRLTTAESPFGGMKGSYPPDYAVGTVYTPTEGIYLTDTSGTNSTKTLTAGKLKELNLLTVDTTAHTITEEFIVENTAESNNPTVINDCTSLTGITQWDGTATRTIENGIKVEGTASAGGSLTVNIPISVSQPFLIIKINASTNCNLKCLLFNLDGSATTQFSTSSRFSIIANVDTLFCLPLLAPSGTTGQLPTSKVANLQLADISKVYLGVSGLAAGATCTYNIKILNSDIGKSAYFELQTPDNLADSSLTLQAWDGSAYQTTGVYKLDSTYSAVSTTTENWKLSDGTKFDDVYGSGLGRALFPKGAAEETKAGSTGSITYSANKGTSKRIGFRVDLPLSDGGRTNFNKCRMKTILTYAPDAEDNYSASYDFADSTNASYGLHHMVKPWIALLEDDTQEIDFYLFDERPKNLKYKQNESGKVYELEVFPGNGNCYHGRIKYSGLTRDTNSDGIPDCLDASVEGSIANFLKTHDFAKDWYSEYDLSTSAITTNDFSITSSSLGIIPFAVSEGDSVSDTNNVILPVAETVSTATGNVSLVDVRGLSAVRVRDTSYTNSGECKVWDTVTAGNTDVATWIRVYNTNWVFSGDKVIENGIIRILYSSTATYSCNLYYHNGSSWVYDRYIRIGVGGSYNSTISTVNFQTISSDAVSLTLRLSGYDQYPTDIHYVNINLIRGVYSAKFTILDTSVINGAGVRIYDETGTVNPLVCTNTLHDFRFSETDSSYYLSDSSGLGYSLNTSGGAIRFQCDPKTTNMRYRLVGTTRYCYGIVSADDAPYSIFVGAIPHSQQMYWEAEALTLAGGATLAEDASAYPFTGNSAIRCTATANVALSPELGGASGQYTIFVRVKGNAVNQKCRFYVYDYTTSSLLSNDTQVNVTETYTIISKTFTKVAEHVVKFVLRGLDGYDINYDYVLVVPTGLIETQAKRALWNASPMTSTFKSSKR